MNAEHLFIMCLLSISCQMAKSPPVDIDDLWVELQLEKKNVGLCSTSTQDYLDKPIEIEKLWKILELKDTVESKEKRLGFTTRTEVIKALPVHTVGAVFQWIEKNAEGNESGSFQITKEEFKDLVQSIPLDLEALKALNKHLEENPSTFVD